jgi:hypothetical protein
MKSSLILSLLFATTLAAQAPPEILSINPISGPTTGGTAVAIVGRNLGLPPNFACVLPCPARVRFGDTEVVVQQETNTLLVAITPSHPAGVVDVTVRTGDGRTVTEPSAFTYTSGTAAGFERVMVPIYLDGAVPGGHGSSWETEFYLRNNGAENLEVAPWPCEFDFCLPVFPLTKIVLPGQTLRALPVFFQPPTGNPSRVFYLRRNVSAVASMHARIFDRSHDANDAGAEIPIIRDNELLTNTIRLHGVSLQPQFRIMLRVYELGQDESAFRVRVYEEGAGNDAAPLREFELLTVSNETGEFRTQAAYGEYAALSTLMGSADELRVEVEPLTEGSRFWAFIAITNNETQRTTLVTPQ